MHIVVTRPLADAAPLAAKLEALGHRVSLLPLLTIVPRQSVEIPRLPWQAVAVTSANAIRSFSGHDWMKSIRMLTVGPQSLAAARSAGFTRPEAHGGDLAGLADFIRATLDPAAGPILYLSGSDTAGDLEATLRVAGFDCRRVVLYDAEPATDAAAIAGPLRQRAVDAVMLYSPRSARLWTSLMTAAHLIEEASVPTYLCLSMNVAAALPHSWRHLVATSPVEAAMLAILEQLPSNR